MPGRPAQGRNSIRPRVRIKAAGELIRRTIGPERGGRSLKVRRRKR